MTTDIRPWGKYTVLVDEENHKIKRIVVSSGARLSLQRHKHRQEHWYVLEGEAVVTLNQETIRLSQGQNVDIPQGAIHRVANEKEQDLVFIEIQTGTYFGEDDIERLEDDYGRL